MTGGAVAAHAAYIASAIKASGGVVNVEPQEFSKLVAASQSPIVVEAKGGFFSPKLKYLTNYKGFFFFTKSPTPLSFPKHVERISAKKIWVPDEYWG